MPDTTLLREVLAVGMGLVFLKMLAAPEHNRSYRIRLAASLVVLVGIALLGLRPMADHPTPWVRYMALFQCVFNLAIAGVLIGRWWIYSPRQRVSNG